MLLVGVEDRLVGGVEVINDFDVRVPASHVVPLDRAVLAELPGLVILGILAVLGLLPADDIAAGVAVEQVFVVPAGDRR